MNESQFIQHNSGSAAAKIEFRESKTLLNIQIEFSPEVAIIRAGFIFFKQVAVKTAKRAEFAAEGYMDIQGQLLLRSQQVNRDQRIIRFIRQH